LDSTGSNQAENAMTYSEASDLVDHSADIKRMQDAMAAAGCTLARTALLLDVGGGAGMHSGMIADMVGKIICTDFTDQNTRFNGEFVKLLHEKFARNGYTLPLQKFEFHAVDAMRLIYRNDLFDCIVSFNAFEHIPDPAQALTEIVRVVKPGGLIYISFDPIWTCDSGSHFHHRVGSPWLHLLESDDEFADAILRNGGTQEEANEYRHAMNRRRLAYYREMFSRVAEQVEYLQQYEWSGCSQPENRDHENFARCLRSGYSEEELLFRGMTKLMRKK